MSLFVNEWNDVEWDETDGGRVIDSLAQKREQTSLQKSRTRLRYRRNKNGSFNGAHRRRSHRNVA